MRGSIPNVPADSITVPVEGTYDPPPMNPNSVAKHPLNSVQVQHARQRVQHDYCKGLRGCWNGVTNFLGASTILTGLAALFPMIYLGAGLIYANSTVSVDIRTWLGPSLGVVGSLTFFFGILCWISLHCKYQNMLYFTVYVYRAIGDWSLISCIILLLAGWTWNFTAQLFQAILASVLPPIFIYLFCATIIDAHRIKMIKDIEIAESVQNVTT